MMQAELHFDGPPDTLSPSDTKRLARLLDRVRDLMLEGRWRTLREIGLHAGGSEASVSARLRDLRKPRFGGYDVQRRPVPGVPGLFEYRVARAGASNA